MAETTVRGLTGEWESQTSWTEHWGSQYERHESLYQLGAITLLMGPAAAGAYNQVLAQNELAAQQEATSGALTQMSQNPLGGIGATGQLDISPGISQWIPFGLAFIVVMYLIFKD